MLINGAVQCILVLFELACAYIATHGFYMSLLCWCMWHTFTTDVGTDSSRGTSSPLARKKKGEERSSEGEECVCGVNYLCWQMFTHPNMHRSVDLAVPHSCQATFVFFFPLPFFMMHAGAVVILAVLQQAFIWAVITSNRFGGNYFTPLLRELQWNITDGSQVNILGGSVITLLCFAGWRSSLSIGFNLNLSSNAPKLWKGMKVPPITNGPSWYCFKSYMQLAFLEILSCNCSHMVLKKISIRIHAIETHHILLVLKVYHKTYERSDRRVSEHSTFVDHMLPIMGEMWKMCVIWKNRPSLYSTGFLMRQWEVL